MATYRYQQNNDPQARFTRISIDLDNGLTALLELGGTYDLTGNEVSRASQYIVLVSSSAAPATPLQKVELPVVGPLSDSDVPTWNSLLSAFVPTALGSGGTVGDATGSAKGIVQLAGDLSGTAASPQVDGVHIVGGLTGDVLTKQADGSGAWATGAGADATPTSKGVVQLAGDFDPASTAALPLVKNIQRVFDPGAPSGSATTDKTNIQAALSAAASAGGGIVQLRPTSTTPYKLGSSPLTMASGYAGQVTIRGHGRGITKVQLTSAGQPFMTTDGSSNVTYQNLTLEDFTADGNSLTSGHIFFTCFTNANFDRMTFRRLDSINVGGIKSGTGRRNIDITVRNPSYSAGDTIYTVTNITVSDVTMNGGNTGVLIEGFVSSGDTGSAQKQLTSPWIAPVWIDNILLERCFHDTTSSPSATQGSAGYQIGQGAQCGRVTIRDCRSYNSSDVGFEMDSVADLLMERCFSAGAFNENYYIVNLGGDPSWNANNLDRGVITGDGTLTAAQRIRLTDCTYRGAYMWINDRRGKIGSVVLTRCGGNNQIIVRCAPPELIIRDCFRVFQDAKTYTGSSQTTQNWGLYLDLQGGKSNVLIDGWYGEITGTIDSTGFSSNIYKYSNITINSATAAKIEIRNPVLRFAPKLVVSGGPWLRPIAVDFLLSARNLTDNLATGSSFGDYLPISGDDTDLSLGASGISVPGVNVTTEQIRAWLFNGASFTNAVIRQVCDGAYWVRHVPGASLTGYKGGAFIRGRVQPDVDANSISRVEGYIADDGTNSYLCLDKIVRGVRTSLLGAIVGGVGTVTAIGTAAITTAGGDATKFSDRGIQLAARVIAGTAYWVRLVARNNTFTADYFTTAPTNTTTAGTNTATGTVSIAADLSAIGGSQVGYLGWLMIPMGTDALVGGAASGSRFDEINVLFDPQISGSRIDRMVGSISASSQLRGLYFEGATSSPFTSALPNYRINGRLLYEKFDHSGMQEGNNGTVGTILDADYVSSAIKSQVLMRDGTWLAVPAAGAQTVGASPWTYTNADGYAEDVIITGGTVSLVEVSRDAGASFSTVATATTQPVTVPAVNPNDQVRVTYSVAPTARKVPRP